MHHCYNINGTNLLSGGLSGSDGSPFVSPSLSVLIGVGNEGLSCVAVAAAGDVGGRSGLGDLLPFLLDGGVECLESFSPLLLPFTMVSLQ